MGPAQTLAANVGLAEGPVFLRRGGLLTVSGDRGHIHKLDGGVLSLFAVTGTGPNGLAEGPDGTVYVAMSGRVGGKPRDGTPVGILAVRPRGRLQWVTQEPVAPNDLCFGPDGLLYFTDPTRGRRDDGRLWRVDVETGEAQLLVSVGWYPNGIGFGPDDGAVLVADTTNGRMMRFPIGAAGLGPAEVAFELDHGVPDGFAFDTAGNIVIATQSRAFANPGVRAAGPDSAGDVQTYSSAGRLVDVYEPGSGENYTNLALSPDGLLVITCAGNTGRIAAGLETGGSILGVAGWPGRGLALHPFRSVV